MPRCPNSGDKRRQMFDRSRQSPLVERYRFPGDRPRGARAYANLGRGVRSRPLQIDQRRVRPRCRRPCSDDGRSSDPTQSSPLRHRSKNRRQRILPRTDVDGAVAIADRLRKQLEAKTIGPLPAGRVTASFGVFSGDAASETLKSMLTAADRRLYSAKNRGRNALHSDARARASRRSHEVTDVDGQHFLVECDCCLSVFLAERN